MTTVEAKAEEEEKKEPDTEPAPEPVPESNSSSGVRLTQGILWWNIKLRIPTNGSNFPTATGFEVWDLSAPIIEFRPQKEKK